jgi:hypothetical protein
LIDDDGNALDTTTVKDCSDGLCRIAAITVPRLYEYVDSSGSVKDVTAGVSMDGVVVFAFPGQRLDGAEPNLEMSFSVELDLATPPDRSNNRQTSGGISSHRTIAMSAASWALVSLSNF